MSETLQADERPDAVCFDVGVTLRVLRERVGVVHVGGTKIVRIAPPAEVNVNRVLAQL